MSLETMPRPYFKITYAGKNVTEEITPHVISVSYTDNKHGKADSISISIEDSRHQWKNDWFPQKGDKIKLAIGYKSAATMVGCGELLETGEFAIDQIDISGPPDVLTIQGQSSDLTGSIRTKRNETYGKMTLSDIAKRLAARNGLAVKTDLNEVTYGEVQQKNQNDAEFLMMLAEESSNLFNIKDGAIMIYSQDKVESNDPIAILDRDSIISYSFSTRTHGVYKTCKTFFREEGAEKRTEEKATDSRVTSTENELVIEKTYTSKEQAKKLAEAALKRANFQKTGSLEIIGNPMLVAGALVSFGEESTLLEKAGLKNGFGNLAGTYVIEKSTHKISKNGGYTTTLEVKENA